MGVKIIYFVHGTTLDNEKHISSGWKDVELSFLGEKQSRVLKEQIKEYNIDVVFCSDLKRAVDSSKITFENEIPIFVDKRLRECNYGFYNGASSDIVEPIQEKSIYKRFLDGESYEDVKKRVGEFLDYLKDNYEGKCVGVVAHKAPQLVCEVLLNNKTWEQAFSEDWRKKKEWRSGWVYWLN